MYVLSTFCMWTYQPMDSVRVYCRSICYQCLRLLPVSECEYHLAPVPPPSVNRPSLFNNNHTVYNYIICPPSKELFTLSSLLFLTPVSHKSHCPFPHSPPPPPPSLTQLQFIPSITTSTLLLSPTYPRSLIFILNYHGRRHRLGRMYPRPSPRHQ